MRPRAIRATPPGIAVVAVLIAACGGQEPRAVPPAPPAPPKDPPLLAQIASACARVSACTPAQADARFRDPGACVDWWLSEPEAADKADPLRACLADAATCEKVSACMRGGGDARAAAFCAQRPGVVSGCDGDRLVSCAEDDGHESSVTDCAAIGASCREVKAAGGLVVRACWSAQRCPAGAPEARCDGSGAVLSCRDGAFERVLCRPGTTCQERTDESGEPVAACELPGRRRCDLRGARYCEDDRLVECERAGHPSAARVTDCLGFGLRCTGVGPRARCSVPTAVECDRELLPKCEGDAVVFCAAGRLAKVSCSGIGLGACEPSAKGPMAACARAPRPGAAPASTPASTAK